MIGMRAQDMKRMKIRRATLLRRNVVSIFMVDERISTLLPYRRMPLRSIE